MFREWASGPLFVSAAVVMKQAPDNLRNIVAPVVAAMGYELVGVEFHPQAGNNLLRVYIDQEQGVTLDDCEAISNQLSAVLDVEDPIQGRYTLEVSSPGLDRPLFEPEHFQRFAGHRARVQLALPRDGRRRFTGELRGVEDGDVVLVVDGQQVRLPLEEIEQARLVPEY